MTNTDSPRLAITPGDWYVSETMRMIRTDLGQMNGFAGIIGTMFVFPQLDSAAAELNDLIVRRTSFPLDKFSAGHDRLQHRVFPISILPRLIVAQLDCLT